MYSCAHVCACVFGTELLTDLSVCACVCVCVCVCVYTDVAFKALGIPPLPKDKDLVTAILQNHVLGGIEADSKAVIAGGDKCYTALLKKCVQ